MDVVKLVFEGWKLYFLIAGVSSLIMAYSGLSEFIRKNSKANFWEKLGLLLSEFLGSLLGWSCLYLLIRQIYFSDKVNAFLFFGAFVGMTGYAYKIGENINSLVETYVKKVGEK